MMSPWHTQYTDDAELPIQLFVLENAKPHLIKIVHRRDLRVIYSLHKSNVYPGWRGVCLFVEVSGDADVARLQVLPSPHVSQNFSIAIENQPRVRLRRFV